MDLGNLNYLKRQINSILYLLCKKYWYNFLKTIVIWFIYLYFFYKNNVLEIYNNFVNILYIFFSWNRKNATSK